MHNQKKGYFSVVEILSFETKLSILADFLEDLEFQKKSDVEFSNILSIPSEHHKESSCTTRKKVTDQNWRYSDLYPKS